MAWSAILFVGAPLLFYGLGAVRHAADPAHYPPAGGTHGLANAIMLISYLGGVAAVLIGTAAGGGDAAAGVLRDLFGYGPFPARVVRRPDSGRARHAGVRRCRGVGGDTRGAVALRGPGGAPAAGALAGSGLAVAVSLDGHHAAGGRAIVAAVLQEHLGRAAAVLEPGRWPASLSTPPASGACGTCCRTRPYDRLVPVSVGGAYTVADVGGDRRRGPGSAGPSPPSARGRGVPRAGMPDSMASFSMAGAGDLARRRRARLARRGRSVRGDARRR